MKKLLLLIPAFAIVASCTSPKSEVNTPAVEDAVVQSVVDSTSLKETQKIVETEKTNQGAAVSSSSENKTVSTASTKSEKKKWSNKKKGVIIGATSGAVAGAIVSKKRVKGAVIGGAVGAGVGLGAGAILDKKENN
jgi:hypothetical protein